MIKNIVNKTTFLKVCQPVNPARSVVTGPWYMDPCPYLKFQSCLATGSKMKLNSLPNIVFYHGIVASAFAIVFLLEAFGVALPSLSLKGQHPNFVTSEYTKAVCLFAAVGIGIFAVYEIFFLPS